MSDELWKCGTSGFTTDRGLSYSIVPAGTRTPPPHEIEELSRQIVDRVNMIDGPMVVESWWLSAYSRARNALRRRDAAAAELKARCERAMAWLNEKPDERVLGEATNYVGFGVARDDLTDAERELLEATRALLVELAKGIRP